MRGFKRFAGALRQDRLSSVTEHSRHPPPNEQDRLVCQRIRLCRIDSRYSQQALAREIGVSRDQLKRIEEKRVAPRFWPTLRFCRLLNINPLWLALGPAIDAHEWTDVADGDVEVLNVPENALFTHAMRSPELMKLFFRKPMARRALPKRGKVGFDDQIEYLARFWKPHVRPTQEREFFSYLASAANEYFHRRIGVQEARKRCATQSSAEVHHFPKVDLVRALQEKLDTDYIKQYLMPSMAKKGALWKNLQRHLRAATRRYGAQAELARKVGVTPQAVAEWLSDASAPTADNALQILYWVTEDEAKQKQGAGSAVTRPARKTQVRKIRYEKPHSGQRSKSQVSIRSDARSTPRNKKK